jgi:hypothetical protein
MTISWSFRGNLRPYGVSLKCLVQDEVQAEVSRTLDVAAQTAPIPVYTVYQLVRRRSGVPRHDGRTLSRFVGRERELALLHERLAHAEGGKGRVVGIAGEPGIGKSRLLYEFAQSLRGQPVMQTAPKFPFRQWGMKPTLSRLQVYNTLRHD